MKKFTKILASLFLVLVAVVGLCSFTACGKDSATHVSTFEELKTAFENGGQITLDKDISYTGNEKGDMIVVQKDASLNLNGKKISIDSSKNEEDLFTVDGAKFTLCGNGSIECSDCFIVSVKNTENSSVVIKEGNYKVTDSATAIHTYGGKVMIEGGKFSNTAEAGKQYGSNYLINKQDNVKTTAEIVITGGEFTGFNPANNTADGPSTNYVKTGYKSVETSEGSGIWKVVKE